MNLTGLLTIWPMCSIADLLRMQATSCHETHDFPMKEGSAVYAVNAGYVEQSRYFEAYGDYVILDHGNGYKTKYANNRKNKIEQGATLTDSIKLLKSITAPGIPPGK